MDDEQNGLGVAQILAAAAAPPAQPDMQQQSGPFGDLVSQFQQSRGGGAGMAYGGGLSGGGQQPALQPPVLNWGGAVDAGQATGMGGLAGMPGSEGGVTDDDAFRMKRQRMQDGAAGLEDMLAGSAPHTSGSSNQLQDLAAGAGWQQGNNSNRMVEGNDLTQVYEQARQQAQQEQQQAMMGMGGFGDVPINSLQQPGGMMMSGRYNLSQNNSMRLQRLDRYGAPNNFGRPPLTSSSAAGPARLTTGHKHEAYLQNIMQKKFSTNPMAQAAGLGGPTMITRNYGQYMQTASPGGYYQRFQGYGAPPVRKPQTADDDADHLLNRCEEVGWLLQLPHVSVLGFLIA